MPLQERRERTDRNDKILHIRKQCELLYIHRNGLYYKPNAEKEENLKIMELLDKQYLDTPFYGILRLTAHFQNLGFSINVKRMRRLMRLVNWETIFREPKTTITNKLHKNIPIC
jgi:putative transposase